MTLITELLIISVTSDTPQNKASDTITHVTLITINSVVEWHIRLNQILQHARSKVPKQKLVNTYPCSSWGYESLGKSSSLCVDDLSCLHRKFIPLLVTTYGCSHPQKLNSCDCSLLGARLPFNYFWWIKEWARSTKTIQSGMRHWDLCIHPQKNSQCPHCSVYYWINTTLTTPLRACGTNFRNTQVGQIS